MANAVVLGPEEMVTRWQQALPNAVVETFNDLLAQKFDGQSATVHDQDLLKALKQKGVAAKDVHEQRWLYQTMELYKEKGWNVIHRSPGWDDNFAPYFKFSMSKN